MVTKQMFHVTDESNVESILETGLRADRRGLVFVTPTSEEAARVGDIYNHIDTPVVLEVEVITHQLRDDPDPHGNIDSHAVSVGDKIPAYDVEVAQ